jgi:ribosomal protein S21
MANIVRVRVEANYSSYGDEREKKNNLINLTKLFKRKCNNYGISHACKEHEFYIKPSEQRRKRKRRQCQQEDKVFPTDNEY